MVVTVNMLNIPHGISGKEPPLNRGQPDLSLPDPSTLRDSGTNQGVGDTNLELLRQMNKHTEHGNIRIRKLNELRRQRQTSSLGLCKVSDSEEEESVPNISAYIFKSSIPTHIPMDSNEASGSNTLQLGTRAIEVSHLQESADEHDHLGNTDWQALINLQDQLPDPKLTKSDYLDYSTLAPAFKFEEALKNILELDPSVILNALKQMAHCRVFIPLLMFMMHVLKTIRDNVGDLYMKKKTGLSAGKYVLNSDCFPDENMLTKQTFFQAYRNWLKLLTEVAEPGVMKGWNRHHELMINDAKFSMSFATWKAHDRHLQTSFFNALFILDVDSRSYSKGFDCEWIASEVSSFQKERSNSPLDSHCFWNIPSQNCPHHPSNNPSHNASSHHALYNKHPSDSFCDNKFQTLCLHCGILGH